MARIRIVRTRARGSSQRGACWAGALALALALGVVSTAALDTTPVASPLASATGGSFGEAAGAGNAAAFDPAFIISDDSFFNYQAMSAADVQSFLEQRTCISRDSAPCLADFRQSTSDRSRTGPGQCDGYTGASDERASRIIWKVAQSCRINPAVLLVLLQKEQSLVTRPSLAGYQKATGYACPDSADCNAKYLGFVNQLYMAGWQLREYTQHPDAWRYRIGDTKVQYHPRLECGSSIVKIRNQATADLYNYTPYQPNADTIANPHGPATSCSTYGNLNFSSIWWQWFGSPLAVRFPDWFPSCLNFVGGQDCPAPSVPALH